MIYVLTALGLSVDAFLVVLLYSTIHKKYIKLLPITIGILHVLFPFFACQLTRIYICEHISYPNILAFLIFLFLGVQQFFVKDGEPKNIKNIFNIFILSVGVSIDSALIGVSYGLNITDNMFGVTLLFGITAFIISLIAIYVSGIVTNHISKMNLKYISGSFFIILGLLSLLNIF